MGHTFSEPPFPKLEYRDSGAATTRLHEVMTDIPGTVGTGCCEAEEGAVTDDDSDEDDGDARDGEDGDDGETGKEEEQQEEMMTVIVFVSSFESLLSLTLQWSSQPPPRPWVVLIPSPARVCLALQGVGRQGARISDLKALYPTRGLGEPFGGLPGPADMLIIYLLAVLAHAFPPDSESQHARDTLSL